MNVAHQNPDCEPAVVGDVNIWTWLDCDPLPSWARQDCLSPEELERLDRTRHPAARERFHRGRILLRNVLGRCLSMEPAALELSLGSFGKPSVSGIQFNMSHTEGVLVLAISRRIVGIDVEVPAVGRDIHGLVKRYFTERENQQFDSLPAKLQPEAFLRGWTCKEAILKALGTGVRDLQNVCVDLDPRRPPRVYECPGSVRWELECWNVGEARAAVCVESPSPPTPLPQGERGV